MKNMSLNTSKIVYGNWLVEKDGELLFVSHKTSLAAVIDKLERGHEYKITNIQERFVKVEKESTVDPEGKLYIEFTNINPLDIKKYLEERYGNILIHDDREVTIRNNGEELYARAKNKLKNEEFEAIIAAIKEEMKNG